MMTTFDFTVDAWVRDVHVEGNSVEDCKERLLNMSLKDLIKIGYVKDFNIKDLDYTVDKFGADVKVTNIQYDLDPDDELAGDSLALPETMDINIVNTDEDSIEEDIIDNIELATNFTVKDFDYEIIRKY